MSDKKDRVSGATKEAAGRATGNRELTAKGRRAAIAAAVVGAVPLC